MNQTTNQNQVKTIYRTPIPTRVLLLVLITVGAAVSALLPDIMTASVCAACTGGVFAFYYVLTFSPSVVLTVIPAYLAALLLTRDPFTSMTVLLFLPVGAVLALCMLKRSGKTAAIVSSSVALTLSVSVLFLISYMKTNGTIAPAALLASFDTAFEAATESLLAATKEAVQTAIEQNQMFAEYYTEAYITSVVKNAVDAMKLSIPALICVIAQILGYLSVAVFGLLVRVFRCHVLLPRPFRVTMSRTSGVVFILSYLINLFTVGNSASLIGVTAGNLATVLMPGLFILGLRSLMRRFTKKHRRRSAVINLVIIGILAFTYPPYAILFVAVDGLGEVFFDGNMLFL